MMTLCNRARCPEIRTGKARRPHWGRVAVALLLGLAAWRAFGTVQGTKHDLSMGTGEYDSQICVFCHTPHFANRDVPPPLWNRYIDMTKVFTLYSSDSLDTTPNQPNTGISILCLGCHDGTAASTWIGGYRVDDKHDVLNGPGPGQIPGVNVTPNCRNCHPEMFHEDPVEWSGLDLSDEHPIAIIYPTPAQDADFQIPPDINQGWSETPLFGGRVECPTCHAVHDPTYVPFLRRSNQQSQLCLTCHIK